MNPFQQDILLEEECNQDCLKMLFKYHFIPKNIGAVENMIWRVSRRINIIDTKGIS